MEPFITLWLFRRAGKLIAAPIGEAAWEEFLTSIGQRIGGGGR